MASEPPLTWREIFSHNIKICLRKYGQKLLYFVAKDLFIHHNLSENGNKSIGEFLKSIPREVGKFKIIENFKFIDDTSKNDSFIDITNCYSIIDLVLKTPYNENFDELNENCRNLNKIRNDYYHKYYFNVEDLNEFKKQLTDSVREICTCMIKFLPSNKISNYKNLLQKYVDFLKVDVKDIEHSLAESNITYILKDMDELSSFILKCQKKIGNIYRTHLKIIPPILDSPPLDLKEVYAPVILKCNFKTLSLSEILLEKSIGKTEPPPIIIIVGDAGQGKTTLCKKLTLDFCDIYKQEKLHVKYGYDLVFYVDMKHVSKMGLFNYIKNVLLPDTFIDETEESFNLFLGELNILIIIDAYDENSVEAGEMLEKLLNLPYHKKVIITTRPHFKEEIIKKLQCKKLLYHIVSSEGFQDEMKYINIVWEHMNIENKIHKNVESFENYIRYLPNDFKNFIKVPIISYLLVYIWLNSNDEIPLTSPENITFTKLYSQVVKLQREAINTKVAKSIDENRNMSELSSIIDNVFVIIYQECFSEIEENIFSFSGDVSTSLIELIKGEILRKLNENYIVFLSSIFKVSNSLNTSENYNVGFEFLHKTQYEYFVACHIANMLVNENKISLLEINLFQKDNISNSIQILSYLIGILSSEEQKYAHKHISEVIEIIKRIDFPHNKIPLLWKFLCETITNFKNKDKNSFFQKKLCLMYANILPEDFHFTDDDVTSGLKLLYYVDSNITNIKIEISDSDPYDIPFFCVAFLTLMKKLKNQQKNTELIIIFNSHMENSNKCSDEFLNYLIDPFVLNLKQFTGYVEKEGVQTLIFFKNLKEITLKITSVEVLNLFCEKLRDMNKLKKIDLIFDAPFNKTLHRLPDITSPDVSVGYLNVKNIDRVVKNLEELKPENKKFQHVTVKLFDYLPKLPVKGNEKNWLIKMEKIVARDLYISSHHDFDSDDDISKEYRKVRENLKYFVHFPE